MIISPTRNFIYLHIPKTGGTSVDAALSPLVDPDRDLQVNFQNWQMTDPGDVIFKNDVKLTKHATARAVRRALGPKVFESYFRFAIVRNPFARVYSAYSFVRDKVERMADGSWYEERKQRGFNPNQPDLSGLPDVSFDELCTDIPGWRDRLGVFKPQVHWLPEAESVSYVGKLESLADALTEVRHRIGAEDDPAFVIPHLNRLTDGEVWRTMSAASVDAIRTHYADDFERFGYSTDPDAPAAGETV